MANPMLNELHRLIPLARAAIKQEGDLENTPDYEEACEQVKVLEAEIHAVAEMVWGKPAQSWADLFARALLADYWADHDPEGRLVALSKGYVGTRAMAHVLASVLAVGQGGPLSPADRTVKEPTKAGPASTVLQAKAAAIRRCYGLHDAADEETWSETGKADPDWAEKLETVRARAAGKAFEIERSLVHEEPRDRIDALILVAHARNLTDLIANTPDNADRARDLKELGKVLSRVVRFMVEDTGKSLEDLGLYPWAEWDAAAAREDEPTLPLGEVPPPRA